MHTQECESPGASPDYDNALCAQQTTLMEQIDVLTRHTALPNPCGNEVIYRLKQEYNKVVTKRAKLAKPHLSNPMEVLPPDVWPDIIRNILLGSQYPVEDLLDLVSVSRGWCSVLTTLPVIWTHIRLDQHEPDYLAKAITCMQLSGNCEIDLHIWNISANEWRDISPMIVPEARRIRSLAFTHGDIDCLAARRVLEAFTKLPVLQEILLPDMPRRLSDQQDLHAFLMEKMPSIRIVNTPWVDLESKIWNRYVTSYSLPAESATKEYLEALALSPQLRYLAFSEPDRTLEDTPSLLKSPFESVTDFAYDGPDVCRRLTWFGNNLARLSTSYPDDGDFNALLVSLSCFPCLQILSLTIMGGFLSSETQNESEPIPPTPENSVKVLNLTSITWDQSQRKWDNFVPKILPASPRLEVLTVHGGFITDLGWNCIQSITQLQDLTINSCNFGNSFLISLPQKSMRTIRWTVDRRDLMQLLPRVQAKFVRSLWVSEDMTSSDSTIATARYIMARSAFPNITSLTISTWSSSIWVIGELSGLRELEVQAPSIRGCLMYWVSYIWEAILMRPTDNPALERITVLCDFIEWDILFLMLERRNFLNEPAVSPIKTLIFSYDLPYRLLYPLSELLGGRFVERDSNHSFSVEVIGERIWDKSIPGCMRCHYSFRNCECFLNPPGPIYVIPKEEPMGMGEKYLPPHKYLAADPALPLDLALWVSGIRERRNAYVRSYEKTGNQVHRQEDCNASKPRSGRNVITGDTLIGAHFEDVYDAGHTNE